MWLIRQSEMKINQGRENTSITVIYVVKIIGRMIIKNNAVVRFTENCTSPGRNK